MISNTTKGVSLQQRMSDLLRSAAKAAAVLGVAVALVSASAVLVVCGACGVHVCGRITLTHTEGVWCYGQPPFCTQPHCAHACKH